MGMATLYEELFEGKQPRKCDDCMHCDVCDEYADVVEKNPDECDWYEEEGRSLYDDIYGRERELPDDRTVEDGEATKLSFDEKCELIRRTPLTSEMTYEERLAMQRRRYGL